MSGATEAAGQAAQGAREAFEGYGDRPLGGYAVLTAAFATGVTASIVLGAKSGRQLPDRFGAGDLVLVGVATHKLSRLISKDKVTSFIRAPFTRFKEGAGQGEVSEEVRGTGLRRATGELLACPYCLSQWIAAGFVGGLVISPRATRLVASVYAAETISDFLQLGYYASEQRA